LDTYGFKTFALAEAATLVEEALGITLSLRESTLLGRLQPP
jgi:hypothetical protein